MKNLKQKLILSQVDNKLSHYREFLELEIPSEGWIYTIRKALKMTLKQLGKKMNISPQSVKEMEKREKVGSITLRSLQEVGVALNMKFVYAFIPKEKSLQNMIEKRAYEIATEIVHRTSNTMKLEAQEVSEKRLQEAIKERVEQIQYEMPGYLWD